MCKVFVLLHSSSLLVFVKEQATHNASDRLFISLHPMLAHIILSPPNVACLLLQHGHEAMSAVRGHLPAKLRPEQV